MTILFSLLLAGYLLLLAEFVVPGGILGVLGAICLVIAGIMGFYHFETSTAVLLLLGEMFSGVLLTIIWFRYFFDSPMGSTLVHQSSLASTTSDTTDTLSELIETTGTTLTPLRPSGAASIQGKRYDVLTEGNMVESGREVRVVKIDGSHIVVRELDS